MSDFEKFFANALVFMGLTLLTLAIYTHWLKRVKVIQTTVGL